MIFAQIAQSAFTYLPSGADWVRIAPELAILGATLLVLLLDLLDTPRERGWLSLIGLAGVLVALGFTEALWVNNDVQSAFFGMVTSDRVALIADVIILVALGLGLLLSPGYIERQGITQHGEYYALLLVSGLGMMLMASATNLMIISTRSRSQEAGMKYFILSSFASAFLLYGMALIYGSTGSTNLSAIGAYISTHNTAATLSAWPLLIIGLGLMAVGLSFKVSAVPFQAWTPDVYTGAPTSITAFMSVGTKVAAFVAILRVFLVALHPVAPEWTPVFWAIAVLTMVFGNILAVTQRDVKRMLAYSSIANAGYILVGVVTNTSASFASVLVYLAAYSAMNIGAFGVVLALERNDGLGTTLDDYAGLARRRPGLAAAMAIFLFSLAGVPPLVGFAAKWYVFYSAIIGGHLELAIIGVLASVAGMYYYLRVVWAMYFTEPRPAAALATVTPVASTPPLVVTPKAEPTEAGAAVAVAEPVTATASEASGVQLETAPAAVTPGTWLALVIATVLTIGFGLFPTVLFDLATQAANALMR
jgi:NADH-quinone oxidoreductase subunit N